MKNFKFKLLILVFSLAIITSCSNDDTNNGKNPPIINSVSPADDPDLQPVTQGYANNMYVIQGSGFSSAQKIYFNDVDTYFNPTLVTDNSIFVTIDVDTPYEGGSNKLIVVTKNGRAEYDFIVAPPAPVVQGFQPVNALEGEEVTIYGNYFLDPVITFDGIPATIISSSLTELVVVMPANAQHKYVEVETISGSTSWGTAVGTAIYDDNFYAPWTIESWNNHEYITDLSAAFQGTTFIKKEIAGWDNIQGNWDYDDQISEYTGIKFAVRSDTPGRLVLIFNGNNWGNTDFAVNTTTEWTEFKFTWDQLNNPAAVQNISFQEFTGETRNYYFDNITYTID